MYIICEKTIGFSENTTKFFRKWERSNEIGCKLFFLKCNKMYIFQRLNESK